MMRGQLGNVGDIQFGENSRSGSRGVSIRLEALEPTTTKVTSVETATC